jgi:hypothetical protein
MESEKVLLWSLFLFLKETGHSFSCMKTKLVVEKKDSVRLRWSTHLLRKKNISTNHETQKKKNVEGHGHREILAHWSVSQQLTSCS